MKPNKVLLTGATGFLGSHIAKGLIEKGYTVLATYRSNSDFWRCDSFSNRVYWLNTDQDNWLQEAIKLKPEVIIHSAWSGVLADTRMDWQKQLTNLSLVSSLLTIAEQSQSEIFIGLGSQAEYGIFDGKISEQAPANPVTGYGVTKLMAYELIRGFFNSNTTLSTRWYWLRVFSCIGEHEDVEWLIPSMIQKLRSVESIELTEGEQRSAYLVVSDFVRFILALIASMAESGIYNMSSIQTRSVKEIVNLLKQFLRSESQLNFGSIPYRPNQPMNIQGDMTKFTANVGALVESDFESSFQTIVQAYLNS
jgi:nucleoside-diphosphate-sugar epimerase